jgi:hypothetical protein
MQERIFGLKNDARRNTLVMSANVQTEHAACGQIRYAPQLMTGDHIMYIGIGTILIIIVLILLFR